MDTVNDVKNSVAAKKAQSDLGNIDWKGMMKSILSFTIQLFILFVIGSRVLLACKYAQTSFLPTSIECMPYETDQPHFHSTVFVLNIDKLRVFDKQKNKTLTYNKRIMFPFTEVTTSHFLIDGLRETSQKYDISGIRMFCVETIKTIFAWHFMLLSGLLNLMNMSPFETLIIVLGPLILRFYISLAFFIGIVITIFACLVNISWLFKENVNNTFDSEGKPNTNVNTCGGPKWGNIPVTDIFNGGLLGIICNLTAGWIFMWIMLIIPIHFAIFIVCLVKPFMETPVIVGTRDMRDPFGRDRDYDFMESIKGLFDTKLDPFMFIVCLNIINTMNIYVNSNAAGAVAVACAAFMIWSVTKPKSPPPYSGSFYINEDVNIKICNPVCKPEVIVQRPQSQSGTCAGADISPSAAGADAGAGAGTDLPPIQYQPVGSPSPSAAPGEAAAPGQGTAAAAPGAAPAAPGAAPAAPGAAPGGKPAAPHKGGGINSIPKIKQTIIDKKMKLLKATLKHMKKQ